VRVLAACEFSGIVREAFKRRGHDAWSCDLLPTEIGGNHIRDDVLKHLDDGWDLMIAHPPCTYLSRAGARWWKDNERMNKAKEAYKFVRLLYDSRIPKVAIENPVGLLSKWWRYPDQVIEPWMFGDIYRKRTCLWLKKLPPLMATIISTERNFWIHSNCRKRKGIHSGGLKSAITFQGIADAMAAQWGI